ncbi:MAG: cytochrome c-type biogenesis protein CcmH [Bryobacterales bacterium]|nr:cytochrome c-type biogenesis protein CcmH [Bryobacterales bacterium]
MTIRAFFPLAAFSLGLLAADRPGATLDRVSSNAGGQANPVRAFEERRDHLYKTFLAPCCWREAVYTHRSSESMMMRKEIDSLLREGRPDAEIAAYYVGKYGERILREPPGVKGRFLYLLPLFALLVGLAAVLAALKMMSGRSRRPVPAITPNIPDSDWDW